MIFPVAVSVLCGAALAHEPAKAKANDAAPGLVIETAQGANPWSHLELRNDPKAFQFAIVTDRTGGARPGVFEDAIHKLNLLQPEFVMSVGDLIEGYTKDRRQIDREWDEFQGFISKLQMPFFYVPGNHDYSNPEMAKAWKERFGKDYYSFVYRGVLFVCLNSQEPQMHHIGEEQAKWFQRTLAEHPDVRWTLVFLHSPLWDETYPQDRGWQRIEKALDNRRYTVFSGHFHSYMKRFRNDHRYYTLATTGGASEMRGPAHGEFDHVAWVTMTDAGPLVTNLMLQGIWGDEIRTPEIRKLVQQAEAGAMISIAPVILPSGPPPDKVRMEVILTNPLATPVELAFSLVPSEGVSARLMERLPKAEDGRYSLILQPRSQRAVGLEVKPTDAIPGEPLIMATFASEAKFLTENKLPVTLRSMAHATVVPRMVLEKPGGPVRVDGDLSDWAHGKMMSVGQPAALQGNQDSWKGTADASFAWAAAADEEFLYLAVDVVDEAVQAVQGEPPWVQDGVEIRIDPRPGAMREAKPDADGNGGMLLAMSPSGSAEDRWISRPKLLPQGTQSVCIRSKTGYRFEAAIPLAALERANPKWREEGVRLNVAVDDRDAEEAVQIWWQPDWRTRRHIPGSGTFFPPGGS